MSSIDIVRTQLKEASDLLDRVLSDESFLLKIGQAADLISASLQQGNKVFSCGNGGSMSDAMHFAEELNANYRSKRRALPALAIADPSYLTCVANDFGYDQVFKRYLEGHAQAGDVLLALSTSGNSPNVLLAAQYARASGLKVITLSGNKGGKLSSHSDIELCVPHTGYSDRIQEVHIKIIHTLIACIEKNLGLAV